MARDGLDFGELEDLATNLRNSSRDAANRQRKFLREEGNKLRRRTTRRARAEVGKVRVVRPKYVREAGTYHKKIKRGKVYTKYGSPQIRVYSYDPVGHLIEHGWIPKGRDGSRGKEQEGKEVFAKALEEFEAEYEADAEVLVDEMIMDI